MLAGTTFTHVASRQKHLSALLIAVPRPLGSGHFERRKPLPDGRGTAKQKPGGKCWRDYMAERSRKREAQVRLLVVSQEAIAQKKRLANLVAVRFRVSDCSITKLGYIGIRQFLLEFLRCELNSNHLPRFRGNTAAFGSPGITSGRRSSPAGKRFQKYSPPPRQPVRCSHISRRLPTRRLGLWVAHDEVCLRTLRHSAFPIGWLNRDLSS